MWKISGFHCIPAFLSTYTWYIRACLHAGVYATNIITYFIVSYEVDAKHCCHIATAPLCQVYDSCIAKLRMEKKTRTHTHKHILKSLTTREWTTLYIIIMIRSFVLLVCFDEIFFRTNSTSINDSNGKQGANFKENIWLHSWRNNDRTLRFRRMSESAPERKV